MSVCRVAMLSFLFGDPCTPGELYSGTDLQDVSDFCQAYLDEGLKVEPMDGFDLQGFIDWAAPKITENNRCGTSQAAYDGRMTTTLNIVPRPFKRGGISFPRENTQGTYHAETSKGQIRIHGVCTNHVNGPQPFDRIFKIGDAAEYDSWNLKFVGNIVAIGPKTVTVKHYHNSANVTRLSLYEFVDRNWDFNEERHAKYNAEELRCL